MAITTLLLGGHGFIGLSLAKELNPELCPSRQELDLLDSIKVQKYFSTHLPGRVILAAAKVGGIGANQEYPSDFLLENLTIQNNVFRAALTTQVTQLIFLGSSCIYPRDFTRPITEEDLLTGPFEPTNEAYAVAKLAGLKLAQAIRRQYGRDFFTLIPANVYGPGDHFHSSQAHVIPSLISKIAEAKKNPKQVLGIWGTGRPVRDFIYVEDLAKAVALVQHKGPGASDWLNVGTECSVSIKELAFMLTRLMEFSGEIIFDCGRPDGMPYKVLSAQKIKQLGWSPSISLEEGLVHTIRDYENRFGKI